MLNKVFYRLRGYMDFDVAKFRKDLSEESDFELTDEIFDYILANSDVCNFTKGEDIIKIDAVNPDIYIIVSGIVRGYRLSDGVETNFYFGMEGTLISSMQGFSNGTPAILSIEACCPTTCLHISKSDIDHMLSERNDFCRWFAGVFTRRSCFDELKSKVMNGNAKWRYEWLERCRPELFEHVSMKAIASYLRMSEVHASRIRKEIARKKNSH